ncbi:MAG: hypothetical protein B6241_04415 [Spirochaetaceae bacterium 4572_59]|nr:MAG: hypothetical protein B6241_04415 [Spirochaetaceae bacterium 4572_59]
MKDEIESIIQLEKESEKRLDDAHLKAAEIKKDCDREMAERTRTVKERLAAEYHEKTDALRKQLEGSAREKLDVEKGLHLIPDNLKEEPYTSIIDDVVSVIVGISKQQRE